jgi:hypothetical protein
MNDLEKPEWPLPIGLVLIMIISLILALTGNLPDGV